MIKFLFYGKGTETFTNAIIAEHKVNVNIFLLNFFTQQYCVKAVSNIVIIYSGVSVVDTPSSSSL
jgi:hypothetical protein